MAILVNPENNIRVEVATSDEIDEAAAAELRELKLSYAELREQAENDEFTSERARRVWYALCPLDG